MRRLRWQDRSLTGRRHLLALSRTFRALIVPPEHLTTSEDLCVPASRDSRASPLHRLSASASTPGQERIPFLRATGSHQLLTFRPRGSSPPRQLAPQVAFVGLLHPTSGPEVRRVSGFQPPSAQSTPEGVSCPNGSAVAVPSAPAPLEEFPSSAAVPRHRSLCLLAVSTQNPTPEGVRHGGTTRGRHRFSGGSRPTKLRIASFSKLKAAIPHVVVQLLLCRSTRDARQERCPRRKPPSWERAQASTPSHTGKPMRDLHSRPPQHLGSLLPIR
jgi:hypothetical protein